MGRVIAARNLRYEYPDGTVGLREADVAIEAGERVAVVGPNGSGKSTLQLLLGGLLEPSAGRVEYFESTTDAESVRDRVGVLLQDPDDYLFNTTVREDIEYGPAQLGLPREEADRRIDRLADELDLRGLLDRPPFRLSGGEKKRAALAAVLAFDPDVLLLDEPTSNVDATRRRTILDLLDRLNRDRDVTLVTFTPAVELVPELADRVYVVGSDGSTVAEGSTRTIMTDETLMERNGLAAPAVVRLFGGFVDREAVPLDVATGRRLLRERFDRE